jgi:hypothetical protein
MSFVLVLPVVWLITAAGVYIAALRSGMKAIKWAIAALLTGPLLLPLFTSHKRLLLSKIHGRNTVLFRP